MGSQEARRESHTTPYHLQEDLSTTDSELNHPQQSRTVSYKTPCSPPAKMNIASPARNCPSKPMTNSHHPKPFFSDRLSFKTTSPNFLFLKIMFLSFVCWTCLSFPRNVHVPNYNSLLFPNYPIFAGKVLFLRLAKFCVFTAHDTW